MNKEMRARKEVQTINNSEKMTKELIRIYEEGICIDEYVKLSDEYKKLYKRYEKTIKVSDCIGNTVMQKNDLLNNNLEYTIKTARHNLFENISEHRKTKNALLVYKEKKHEYEDAFKEIFLENKKVKRELELYKKYYGEIKNSFSNELDIENSNKVFQNISFERVLSLFISKSEDSYKLIKLKMNNYDEIEERVKSQNSLGNFITKISSFLESNLDSSDLLYSETNGVFFIVLKNKEIKDFELFEKRINSKRDIYTFKISFTAVMSEYKKDEDTIDKILKRCDIALQRAILEKKTTIC